MENGDWLDDPRVAVKRDTAMTAALNVARLHQVFVSEPRAKQLFDLWKQAANQRVPVNATIDQYARAEALRSFIQTIEDQIKFAAHDGRAGD